MYKYITRLAGNSSLNVRVQRMRYLQILVYWLWEMSVLGRKTKIITGLQKEVIVVLIF